MLNTVISALGGGKNLKALIFPMLIAFAVLTYSGCKSDSVTNPLGANVTMAMGSQPGPNGGTLFTFKPSVDVKLNYVIVTSGSFRDSLNDGGVYVYSKDSTYGVQEYQGVASGQQWSFNFFGTLASGGTAFSATANYTVPQ